MRFRKLVMLSLIATVASSPVPNALSSLIGDAVFSAAFAQTLRVDRINIVEAGIYEAEIVKQVPSPGSPSGLRNIVGDMKLLARSVQVTARKGVHFGTRYIVVGAPKGNNVDIRIITRFPSPGLRNPKTGEIIFRSERTVPKEIGATSYSDYSLDDDWEIVPGVWTFEFWYKDRKLAEQSFTLMTP